MPMSVLRERERTRALLVERDRQPRQVDQKVEHARERVGYGHMQWQEAGERARVPRVVQVHQARHPRLALAREQQRGECALQREGDEVR